jgi:nitrogen fixation/metabolism regulation signal transduction histidine kinase
MEHVLSLPLACEAILAAGRPDGGLSALIAGVLGAGLGAVASVYWMRRRAQPVRQICRNLNQLSSDLQSDLRQLQIEDTAGQLGSAWNRLIEEIVTARRELESIHVRQQARETLNQYEMKWFSQLLNQIPYGLVTVAEDWLITFANTAAERLLGSPEGGLKGKRLTDFVAKDLSNVTPGSGIAIDQITQLHASPALIRMMAVNTEDQADRGETALLLQDVTHERERENERG